MAEESVDSGLSSEQSQASRSKQPASQNFQNYPSASPRAAFSTDGVNLRNNRMSTTGSGSYTNTNAHTNIDSNAKDDQNHPASSQMHPRHQPPHAFAATPIRVHFGPGESMPSPQLQQLQQERQQRCRPSSRSIRGPQSNFLPAPFIRSFSTKAFELPDRLAPPPVQRPLPQQDLATSYPRDIHIDKGIQCERGDAPSNPLLHALLAAANATVGKQPRPPQENPTPVLRRNPYRAGSLPYWSDSEVNAYDSVDTFSNATGIAAHQQSGPPTATKSYPSASVVAAAATAAAMALAAVQSSSRPTADPIHAPEGSLGTPMARSSLNLDDLSSEPTTIRDLTEQFAEASLYSRFALGEAHQQRKSVNFDTSSLHRQDNFADFCLSDPPQHSASQQQQIDQIHPRFSIGQRFPSQEQQFSQTRFSQVEEPNLLHSQHQQIPQFPPDSNQDAASTSCAAVSVRPTTFNSSQFNPLFSEPYPNPPPDPQCSLKDTASGRCRGQNQDQDHDDSDAQCNAVHKTRGGLLIVNIIAGSGLKTSQMLLRDLYCVLETDSVRKARSMIRTSTDFFEWDEVFEIEMEESRFLSILIYQWDPRSRHRLCFYGGIELTALIQQIMSSPAEQFEVDDFQDKWSPLTSPYIGRSGVRFEKIALQLEPKGVLYLQVGYLPMKALFQRRRLTFGIDSTPFGIRLDELVYRNRLLVSLGVLVPDSGVPLVIRKCVEEIDRRGTEVVGIYRLSGSVWMKLQVRDLFVKTSERMVQGLAKRNIKAVRGAYAALDLSADIVPDIHAITATLKDFFRELPEPLFTNALYPMVYEATQVAGTADPGHIGTKLILNILDCLPTSNQEVLLYLLDHLKRVTSKSEVNKMNSHNLAVSLAPCLLHPSSVGARDVETGLLEHSKMVSILECILDIWP